MLRTNIQINIWIKNILIFKYSNIFVTLCTRTTRVMSFKKITRFMRIIIYTKITGFSGNVRFTIIARITRLPRNSRFTRNIRFTRCKNFKILAKSEYNEQISKYSRHIWTVVQVQSVFSFVKTTLRRSQRRQRL